MPLRDLVTGIEYLLRLWGRQQCVQICWCALLGEECSEVDVEAEETLSEKQDENEGKYEMLDQW
jgi:hypothetical protein